LAAKKEIKCPHCKEWTLWRGETYDRCLYCNEFLQNEVFIAQVERKIMTEVKEEADLFFIKPSDGPFKRGLKRFFRRFRKIFVIIQASFIAFMTFLLWIIGLMST
jgi:phage FluMu protein Com